MASLAVSNAKCLAKPTPKASFKQADTMEEGLSLTLDSSTELKVGTLVKARDRCHCADKCNIDCHGHYEALSKKVGQSVDDFHRAEVVDVSLDKDGLIQDIKVHWKGTRPGSWTDFVHGKKKGKGKGKGQPPLDKWVPVTDCRAINQFQVLWEDINSKLPLAQDENSRSRRKATFEDWNKSGTKGKAASLTLKELERGVHKVLTGDIGIDVEEAAKVVKSAWTVSRGLNPAKQKGKKAVDRREFHGFIVAFRCYLEIAQLFENLDAKQEDDQKLSFRECHKGMKHLKKWGIGEHELQLQFEGCEVCSCPECSFDLCPDCSSRHAKCDACGSFFSRDHEGVVVDTCYYCNYTLTRVTSCNLHSSLDICSGCSTRRSRMQAQRPPVDGLEIWTARWKFPDFARYCIEKRWGTMTADLELDSDDEEVLVEQATGSARLEAGFTTPKSRLRGQELDANRQKVRQAFRTFDTDDSGFISHEEITRIFGELDPMKFTPAVVEALLKGVDRNSDGMVDHDEFCLWMFAPTIDDVVGDPLDT